MVKEYFAGLLLLLAWAGPSWSQSLVLRAGGVDGYEFGRIQDVGILPGERLVALDGANRQLVLIDRSGQALSVVGRDGRGPGEFSAPTALVLTSTDDILVLDPSLRRISTFRVVGATLRLVGTTQIDHPGFDMCRIGTSLFLQGGSTAGHPITEFRLSANQLVRARELGSVKKAHPQGEHPIIRSYAATGRIACASDGRSVLWLSDQLNTGELIEVATGHAKTIRLPDFQEVRIEVAKGGAVRNSPPRGGKLQIHVAIASIAGGDYAISSEVQSAAQASGGPLLVRRVAASGSADSATATRGALMAVRGDQYACVDQREVPEVRVIRSRSAANVCR